jgi:TonB family protein
MPRILPLAGALILAAAAATVAQASPASDAWVSRTGAALQSQVGAAGLSDDGKAVQLRVKVAPDGAGALMIAGSSGSRDFDDAVKAAARKADIVRPPAELVGRTVTFRLGDSSAVATGAN